MNRDHDYSGVVPRSEETLYKQMADAISYQGLWTWLREYEPNRYDQGFPSLHNHPYLDSVRAQVNTDDYTFYKIACAMETIAKRGWEDWMVSIGAWSSNRMW